MKQLNLLNVRVALLILVGLVVLMPGCVGDSQLSPTPATLTQTDGSTGSGSGGVKYARYWIYFQDESFENINLNNTTLNLSVGVQVEGYSVSYESFMFCAYNGAGDLLQSETLGNISVSGGQVYRTYTVEYTADKPPHYMIVDHPEIRNNSKFNTTLNLIMFGSGYSQDSRYPDELQNRFEWPRTNETGKCG